ncbi:energy-coupling factor transporter transmembrane component T family protein [Pectinatus haikarae]|uniref:energy-coupling factor transporter transmembrane component T family protein n=1 Tax=Pectinatus haikarae TaxID=349096 RepID=UPI0018C85A84|nr:energy-coupling factor transporter transmembrane component T [Pectinatus haikarae]
MLDDMMLGQFFPADSVLHRMDARLKIMLLFIFIIAIFLCDSKTDYILLTLLNIILMTVSKIPFVMYLKAVKPMFWIVLFTFIMHIFSGEGTIIADLWIFSATWEGLTEGIFITLRLILLVLMASILTFTTSPLVLTDALESLLSPFKKIGVPAHELSMMMTIALRFIPTLITETDKIIKAQKSRGADFSSGNIIQRIKYIMPILIPLFVSAFRRADELALAMESRCYRGGQGRTRMKEMKFGRLDFFIAAIAVLIIAGMIVLKIKGI